MFLLSLLSSIISTTPVPHALPRLLPQSMRLVAYQGDDHAVQVEEEHEEVKAEFDEGFFLVDVEFAEDLGCVEEVLVVEDSRLGFCAPVSFADGRFFLRTRSWGGSGGRCEELTSLRCMLVMEGSVPRRSSSR